MEEREVMLIVDDDDEEEPDVREPSPGDDDQSCSIGHGCNILRAVFTLADRKATRNNHLKEQRMRPPLPAAAVLTANASRGSSPEDKPQSSVGFVIDQQRMLQADVCRRSASHRRHDQEASYLNDRIKDERSHSLSNRQMNLRKAEESNVLNDDRRLLHDLNEGKREKIRHSSNHQIKASPLHYRIREENWRLSSHDIKASHRLSGSKTEESHMPIRRLYIEPSYLNKTNHQKPWHLNAHTEEKSHLSNRQKPWHVPNESKTDQQSHFRHQYQKAPYPPLINKAEESHSSDHPKTSHLLAESNVEKGHLSNLQKSTWHLNYESTAEESHLSNYQESLHLNEREAQRQHLSNPTQEAPHLNESKAEKISDHSPKHQKYSWHLNEREAERHYLSNHQKSAISFLNRFKPKRSRHLSNRIQEAPHLNESKAEESHLSNHQKYSWHLNEREAERHHLSNHRKYSWHLNEREAERHHLSKHQQSISCLNECKAERRHLSDHIQKAPHLNESKAEESHLSNHQKYSWHLNEREADKSHLSNHQKYSWHRNEREAYKRHLSNHSRRARPHVNERQLEKGHYILEIERVAGKRKREDRTSVITCLDKTKRRRASAARDFPNGVVRTPELLR